jgi:hypothetical protein
MLVTSIEFFIISTIEADSDAGYRKIENSHSFNFLPFPRVMKRQVNTEVNCDRWTGPDRSLTKYELLSPLPRTLSETNENHMPVKYNHEPLSTLQYIRLIPSIVTVGALEILSCIWLLERLNFHILVMSLKAHRFLPPSHIF